MIQKHYYPGDAQLLLRWAINRGEAEQKRRDPPEPFKSWVRNLMPVACRNQIGYWVGSATPKSKLSADGKWLDRFPHRHIDSMGWPREATTIMTYLAEPLEGGDIAIGGLSPDDPYEEIEVEIGLTLMVDSATWHGVRPVPRGTRIVLLTTGMPS